MFRVPSISGLFKWRQFEPEVILMAVGWYLRFSLSYRDVEELLAERGLHADHVTVWRFVQRYAPELQQCLSRHLKPTNDRWRLDETCIRVKGKWRYLYRAVDSTGATLDFLLSAKRDARGMSPHRGKRTQQPCGEPCPCHAVPITQPSALGRQAEPPHGRWPPQPDRARGDGSCGPLQELG